MRGTGEAMVSAWRLFKLDSRAGTVLGVGLAVTTLVLYLRELDQGDEEGEPSRLG